MHIFEIGAIIMILNVIVTTPMEGHMGAKKIFPDTRIKTIIYLDPEKKEYAQKAYSMSTYINNLIALDMERNPDTSENSAMESVRQYPIKPERLIKG